VDEIQPRATIVLNLFRDQLDRYGELSRSPSESKKHLRACRVKVEPCSNADDPRVAEIGMSLDSKPIWFGLDDTSHRRA